MISPKNVHTSDISNYGFIADGKSAALIHKNGSIDWMCWPRYDSDAIFSKLLDSEKGGFWNVQLDEEIIYNKQIYIVDTNILITILETKSGTLEITDWLHCGNRQALCRSLKATKGIVQGKIKMSLCKNFTSPVNWIKHSDFLVAEINNKDKIYTTDVWKQNNNEEAKNNFLREAKKNSELVCDLNLVENDSLDLAIGYNQTAPSNLVVSKDHAKKYWRSWVRSLRLPEVLGLETVRRAALTIKGLQYEPTGALVSSATTSIPRSEKHFDPEDNADKRFSWVREAAFASYALLSINRPEEVESYFDWLGDQALNHDATSLQLLNPIGEEVEAKTIKLSGWKGLGPVKTGVHYTPSLHLDTIGELVDAISIHHRRADDIPTTPTRWKLVSSLANTAAENWQKRDYGFWGRPDRDLAANYTYSKVQCWVALDRALRMASKAPAHLINGDTLDLWRQERARIKDDVLDHGWNEELGSFTHSYDSDDLDSTNLLLARFGFVLPTDEKFISTVRTAQKKLVNNFGMVRRYKSEFLPEYHNETLPVCSLWMVLALIEIKEYGEAEILYNRILGQANHLGLFSESLDENGRQLGNYPELGTETALIIAAFALDRHRDRDWDRRRFL